MKCTILTGSPGSQKTKTMLERMLSAPSRYVVALPRNALIEEKARDLIARARETRVTVAIVPIHSDQPRKKEQNVLRRVEDALRLHSDSSHVILLVSHETFSNLDASFIEGWHVGIDENLDNAVAAGSFSATATWSALDRQYGLDPLSDGQTWEVRPREGVARLKRGEFTKDVAQDLVEFHKCCNNPNRVVFVDIGNWEDARRAGRKIRWWSIWSPTTLEKCASLTIAAANYLDSLPYHAARWLHGDDITFTERNVGAGLVRANPKVRVHYFTQEHVGSTEWWESDEGNACLVAVSIYIEGIGGVGFYSCNQAIRDVFRNRFPGQRCDPKLAGTNELIHHTSCMFIYSNKSQDSDRVILDLLGLDRNAIRSAREFEDIRQFVMRGIIRRPEYDGDYDVYVYDLAQAEDLKRYLREVGITNRVELVPVHEAGIMDVVRPASQRASAPSKQRAASSEVRRENDKLRKRQDRAEKKEEAIRNGTYRARGRPAKVRGLADGNVSQ
jgi:hypothetical protein